MLLAHIDKGVYRLQPPRCSVPRKSEVVRARGADEEVCGSGGGGTNGCEHCDAGVEGAGVCEVQAGGRGRPYFETVGFARGS